MDFKVFLRRRREELGFTQAYVAEELTRRGQVTSSARVGHWETGRNKPPIENPLFRDALAATLRIDVNNMMTELGFVIVENARSHEAALAANIIDHLPSDARQLALDYLYILEKRFSTSKVSNGS